MVTARLACVRHAASVSSEPGSNSPLTFCELRLVVGDFTVARYHRGLGGVLEIGAKFGNELLVAI